MAMDGNKAASVFSPNNDYLAYSGIEGTLRILDTSAGSVIADFSASKYLSATCTCLQWGPGRHLRTTKSPKKKKQKKSVEVETAVDNLQLIAMGMTNGTVLLYSFSKDQIHSALEKGHVDSITDLCWYPSGTTLYSSSIDGHVVEWDIPLSQIKFKWKASESVHSMCLCSSSHLLTADRRIKMWDLNTRTLIKEFTGHSTEVFRLLPVLAQTAKYGSGEPSECSYFLSAAEDNNVINAWNCDPGSKEEHAITSLSIKDAPKDVSIRLSCDKVLTLAVLTAKGKVLVFEHTLNGKLKKPLYPKTVVRAEVSSTKEDVPIIAAIPVDKTGPCLLVAYGSTFKPTFESVALDPSRPEVVLTVSGSVKKTSSKDEFSTVKTPDISGGTVVYSSQMLPQSPGMGGSKRKRKQSASELTLEDRLQAMGSDKPQTPGGKRPPKADQLVVQLTQGLQSKDGVLLQSAFQEKNLKVIQNTVQRLPLNIMTPLLKEVTERMKEHSQNGLSMSCWFTLIITMHKSLLMTIPEAREVLEASLQFIKGKTENLAKKMEQVGRCHAVISRAPSQDQEEAPSGSAEALLVYQDVIG